MTLEIHVRWYAETWQAFNMNGASHPWRIYAYRDLDWMLRVLAGELPRAAVTIIGR